MWHKQHKGFFEEADDGLGLSEYVSGGGSGGTPTEAAPEVVENQPNTVQLDQKTFETLQAQSIETAVRRMQQQQPSKEPSPFEMDDATFNKRTHHWVPDEAFVKAIFAADATPQQRLQAMQEFVANVYKHTNHVAGLGIQYAQHQFGESLKPLNEFRAEQQRREFESTLTKKYPSLVNFKHLIPQAVAAVKASGAAIATADEAATAVGQMIAAFVKQQPVKPGQPRVGMPPMAKMTKPGAATSAGGGGSKEPNWKKALG